MDDVAPIDEEAATRRQLFAKQHLDERRLAGAAGTDDEYEIPRLDIDVHMVESHRSIFVDFRDVAHMDHELLLLVVYIVV